MVDGREPARLPVPPALGRAEAFVWRHQAEGGAVCAGLRRSLEDLSGSDMHDVLSAGGAVFAGRWVGFCVNWI